MAQKPIKNQDVAFSLLQEKLEHVTSERERQALLQQLVTLEPRGDRAQQTRARYKREIETLKRKAGSRDTHSDNPYEGIAHERQVVIVGETNAGKSALLERLTGCGAAISAAPFATYRPEIGMHVFRDVAFQIVEVPAIFRGEDHPRKYQFIRNADVLCIAARDEADADSTIATLGDHGVTVAGHPVPRGEHRFRPRDEGIHKPGFIAAWTPFAYPLPVGPAADSAAIGEAIYRLFGIIRIYSCPGATAEGPPLVFPAGVVTVGAFAAALDQRNARRYHRARIRGEHADFEGQVVGMDHALYDGDRVTLLP